MKAYQPIKDSMGCGGPMPFVYQEKRAAEIWCEEHNEEWISYKPKEVEVRELTQGEGAVGGQLVQIRRDTSDDTIRARAMKKLNAEERRALGLSNDGTQRPGSPDGSLATETRKPGSLK